MSRAKTISGEMAASITVIAYILAFRANNLIKYSYFHLIGVAICPFPNISHPNEIERRASSYI